MKWDMKPPYPARIPSGFRLPGAKAKRRPRKRQKKLKEIVEEVYLP